MNPHHCLTDPARYPNKADAVFNAHEVRRQRALAHTLTDQTVAEYAANPWGINGPHSLGLQNLLLYFATCGVGGSWHRVVALEPGRVYGVARVARGQSPQLLDEPRRDSFEGIVVALFELRCAELRKCLNADSRHV